KITKVDTKNGSAYLSAFTQEKTPLEKLFEGEKLFLAPLQWPRSLQLSTAVRMGAKEKDPGLVRTLLPRLPRMKWLCAGTFAKWLCVALVVNGTLVLLASQSDLEHLFSLTLPSIDRFFSGDTLFLLNAVTLVPLLWNTGPVEFIKQEFFTLYETTRTTY